MKKHFSARIQTNMKQWNGYAHGDQSVRSACEKRVGRFDFRGGFFERIVCPSIDRVGFF